MANLDDITVVTACDPDHVKYLRISLPNLITMKNINRWPIIVYINGFKNGINDVDLHFINKYDNIKLIEWNMENVSQRERMLSSFIFGPAKDVQTSFWLKLDADTYAIDNKPILMDDMKEYVICGHKWNYSWADHIKLLDIWANANSEFDGTLPMFNINSLHGSRFYHKRVSSFIQLHQTDFTIKAAILAGNKLPIPSQDTFLFYIASRLGLKIKRHNFKKHNGIRHSKRQLIHLGETK